MKIALHDANLPHYPKWVYIDNNVVQHNEYSEGWWTVKGDVVIQISQLNRGRGFSVRPLFNGDYFDAGWKYYDRDRGHKWVTEEDWDNIEMEELL